MMTKKKKSEKCCHSFNFFFFFFLQKHRSAQPQHEKAKLAHVGRADVEEPLEEEDLPRGHGDHDDHVEEAPRLDHAWLGKRKKLG